MKALNGAAMLAVLTTTSPAVTAGISWLCEPDGERLQFVYVLAWPDAATMDDRASR